MELDHHSSTVDDLASSKKPLYSFAHLKTEYLSWSALVVELLRQAVCDNPIDRHVGSSAHSHFVFLVCLGLPTQSLAVDRAHGV
jgi:hypothetical protein